MKIINILGGLGNQMFQYALAVSLRAKFPKEDILVDISNFRGYPLHNGYELDKIFNLTIKSAKFSQIIKVGYPYMHYQLWRIGKRILPKRKSMILGFQDRPFDEIDCNMNDAYYDGYWQSECFFKNYRNDVLKEFKFPEISDKKNLEVLMDIKGKKTLSIHIRRGDYVNHPLFKDICTINYYKNALKTIRELSDIERVLVFSNDSVWCEKMFISELPDINPTFVNWNSGNQSFRDMQLMSYCSHNIIANSSFSWWGAWLNQNPGKIVIAPIKWCNRDIPQSFYIPNSWIKVEI